MSDLLNQLTEIVRKVLPHLTSGEALEVAEHLTSDEVGVTSLPDLSDLSIEMMPRSLAPLKRNQLFKALKASAPATAHESGSNSKAGGSGASETRAETSTSEASSNSNSTNLRERRLHFNSNTKKADFKFNIKWSDYPQATIEKLSEADNNKESAHPNDQQAIKLAIAKKMCSSYVSYREAHPGSQLSPGREVYADATKQLFTRFKECFKIRINGNVIGDGMQTFVRRFEICAENLIRKEQRKGTGTKVQAKKGKGTVGVLIGEYEPKLAPASKTEQEGIREHLKNYYQLDALEQDLDQVTEDLDNTYELQRQDIISAKQDVLMAAEDKAQGDENVDDELAETALKVLLREWPFLFQPAMIRRHHKRLTGKDIHLEKDNFCEKKLDFLLLYMTTSSSSNVQNMALRLKAERGSIELGSSERLMMVLLMVANHFKEDSTSLIYCTERTRQMDELDIETNQPCIVAFGQDPIAANTFAVCADKTPLIKCFNAGDAITCLFEICFVFDLEYPPLKLTVEFFERFVFGMAFSESRIERKGKTILTITEAVRRLINGLQAFEDELEKAQENN